MTIVINSIAVGEYVAKVRQKLELADRIMRRNGITRQHTSLKLTVMQKRIIRDLKSLFTVYNCCTNCIHIHVIVAAISLVPKLSLASLVWCPYDNSRRERVWEASYNHNGVVIVNIVILFSNTIKSLI